MGQSSSSHFSVMYNQGPTVYYLLYTQSLKLNGGTLRKNGVSECGWNNSGQSKIYCEFN